MKNMRALIAGVAVLGFIGCAAIAAPAPSETVKPSETKTYGDWTVRCYPVASPSPCDMYELLANKQTNQRVMSVSIAFMPAREQHVIQIAVPLGIYIPKGLMIESEPYKSGVLPYRRCDRAGCYVERLLDASAVRALARATNGVKVKIVADNGKVFEIPFSLKGYSDAHGAMVDLARKKVAGATPPAAPTTPAPATPQ